MKGVVYMACVCSMLVYEAEAWAMNVGAFQRLQIAERRMLRMICRVTLKDIVESTVIASRVEVDDSAFEAEKIEVVWTYCKKR